MLRSVKSPGEIALLRRASEVGSRTIEAMLAASVPGASHGDIVAAGLAYLVPAGGVLYNSFMASGKGGDPSRFAKSNFPTWGSQKRLAKGDWIRFGISGALVLLSIAGGSDLGLFEVNEAAEIVESAADSDANIIFGAVIDDAMGDEVRVTVIATGFHKSSSRPSRARETVRERRPDRSPGLDDRSRSSLEISDDDIDIPAFLRD